MKTIDRRPALRVCLALAAAGLVAAGCSQNSATGRFLNRADEALTARSPWNASPADVHPTANCREWHRFNGRRDLDERRWKFGCVNAASLVVSVSDKRDLRGGRPLKRSEAWEAVQTMTLDREGKLDPGQVDTSKSATTSSSK